MAVSAAFGSVRARNRVPLADFTADITRGKPLIRAALAARGRTLDEALADDAYALPEEYVGPVGFSWIHRWSMAKGLGHEAETDPPDWVREGFEGLAP